jgi:hypothetical protein
VGIQDGSKIGQVNEWGFCHEGGLVASELGAKATRNEGLEIIIALVVQTPPTEIQTHARVVGHNCLEQSAVSDRRPVVGPSHLVKEVVKLGYVDGHRIALRATWRSFALAG